MFDGLRHHLTVAREAYRAEKQGAPAPRRDRHERDFLPAVLEVTESPAAPAGRALLWLIVAFFVIALGWSLIGHIDIVATAPGRIVPTARVKIIQPLEAGVVRAVHVRDGDRVAAGQVLVELDPTESRADRDRFAHDLLTARLEAARLSALSTPEPEAAFDPPAEAPDALVALHQASLRSAWAAQQAQLAALDGGILEKEGEIAAIRADIARLGRLLPNIRERVERRRGLTNDGTLPRLAFLELEQELIEAEEGRTIQRHRLEEAQGALAALLGQREQADRAFRADVLARRAEAERQVAGLEQDLLKAEDRHARQTLTAPVDGTVQQLALHTIGGVAEPAAPLMVIVPADSPLEVEVRVLNKDAGWVEADQPAEIKVEAFPFTKYGVIDGRVEHLSRDAVEDENLGLVYPARVSLSRTTITSDGAEISLSAGMAVSAEIKTGTRRVIEYLLAPLLRYKDESLKER